MIHAVELDPVEPLSDGWFEQRLDGLGGSDAAAVLGVDRFRSPFAVYVEKTERLVENVDNDAMEWGRRLEEPVAQAFADRTGYEVRPAPAAYAHPAHPYLRCNLDRLVYEPGADDPVGLLEVKTAGPYVADSWEDGVPLYYRVQVHHELAVTGLPRAWVAVLIGGRDFRTFEVPRDEATIDALVAREAEWWRSHVEALVPPPVDGDESTVEALKRLYADVVEESEVDLPDDAETLLLELQASKGRAANEERLQAQIQNELRAALGNAEVGLIDGVPAVTWKAQGWSRVELDELRAAHPAIVQEFTRTGTRRVLRIVKRKGNTK